MDFETYSEAGYVWNEAAGKWDGPPGAPKSGKAAKGLGAVGAPVYSEHPSTEVLTLSYRLPAVWTGYGGAVRYGGVPKRWRPGLPLPYDLFEFLACGGLMGAHNAMFERLIWTNVCVPKYGFPPLPFYALRCSAATARVSTYPGKLGELAKVLRLDEGKDTEGTRLLNKFSVPQKPTKKNPALRIRPEDDPEDAERLYAYCDRDIAVEEGAAAVMPDMTADELAFWLIDQEINWRGVAVDLPSVRDCIAVLQQALDQYGEEFRILTGGLEPSQVQATVGWLRAHGCFINKLDDEHVTEALTWPLDPRARRVLEIRQLVGSASVKKLFSMDRRTSCDGRLRDLIVHHGARTGRPTGDGPQPLNLPKAGPDLRTCEDCGNPSADTHSICPWCASPGRWVTKDGKVIRGWNSSAMTDPVLRVMQSRNLAAVEWFFGDAVLSIMGAIRGLFVAGEGLEFICSDFSAIEAVVTAQLAGEQWRIDAFHRKEDIYLASASSITGTPLEEYKAHKARTGDHHPHRQKIGKPAELGLGFGGWVSAWRVFDNSDTFTDDQVKTNILGWREASPAIVEFWGGQHRDPPWFRNRRRELFGLEGAAITALQNPDQVIHYRGLQFYVVKTGPEPDQDALKIRLLSGRELTYHEARLTTSPRDDAEWAITYKTWNSNPSMGPLGWVVMSTYGGRLCENVVQATAHDILRFAIVNLRAAGYPTVLHVYDEILVEVPLGFGSIEEVERIMATMPPWAAGWPIRADGGWRGFRYRKV